mgnify:FL=1
MFLAAKYCKDCQMLAAKMVTKTSSMPMLFYCVQGINGFDASDDDPMKEELMCDNYKKGSEPACHQKGPIIKQQSRKKAAKKTRERTVNNKVAHKKERDVNRLRRI